MLVFCLIKVVIKEALLKKSRRKYSTSVAISYDPTMDVPKVESFGHGEISSKIQKIARRYGVPIVRNKKIVEQIAESSSSQEISEDLYTDLARIFNEIEGG